MRAGDLTTAACVPGLNVLQEWIYCTPTAAETSLTMTLVRQILELGQFDNFDR